MKMFQIKCSIIGGIPDISIFVCALNSRVILFKFSVHSDAVAKKISPFTKVLPSLSYRGINYGANQYLPPLSGAASRVLGCYSWSLEAGLVVLSKIGQCSVLFPTLV